MIPMIGMKLLPKMGRKLKHSNIDPIAAKILLDIKVSLILIYPQKCLVYADIKTLHQN
jgi:hypothetical protein